MSGQLRMEREEHRGYEAGPAYGVYRGEERIGRVARHSHTYRTTYTGSRIGYDRHHYCWWGELNGIFHTFRCYRTRGDLLAVLERQP